MRNAGLEEAQAGIRIAGRNINNLRYADDTTIMAESEEELKSLLMKVGTFLAVQWLGLHLPMHGVQFPSLVREPRSHMLYGMEQQMALENLNASLQKNSNNNS